ncbi:MAG TPA: fatty acid desaturase [Capsulimonadaceae bacterium]|jgi:fatty acid desaturase
MSDESRAKSIKWYRTPIEPDLLKALYRRSDFKAAIQTLGYLGIVTATALSVLYSASHWPWYATVALLLLHGTCYAFMINGVHELGHDTVFKTRWLNVLFVHIMAFLGWINHRLFEASHVRHHRSTLHPPDDLEVVVPIKITWPDFKRTAIVNPMGIVHVIKFHARVMRGQFQGDWELKLFPESNPERRKYVSSWARTLLIGHALLLVTSLVLHIWLLPVLISLAPFYGGWLFFLCNNTQHVGLQDNSTDFRVCCRTFLLNPVPRFLYWQMNYHIEHHMYPGVPCYNLAQLRMAIEYDLPPAPQGIAATWREISDVLKRQAAEPGYQYQPALPANNTEVLGNLQEAAT